MFSFWSYICFDPYRASSKLLMCARKYIRLHYMLLNDINVVILIFTRQKGENFPLNKIFGSQGKQYNMRQSCNLLFRFSQ